MSVYQHFNKDEYHFIDKILELKTRAIDYYTPQLTHFLNPREQYIAQSLFSKNDDVQLYFFDNSERTRAIIAYDKPNLEQFEFSILQINYPMKFESLTHRHILGTLIGSGIKRNMIGNIITDGKQWQVAATNSVVPYICQQITKIGGVPVNISLAEQLLEKIVDDGQIINALVSSPRVDVIVSEIFNVSRQQAKALVESNQVTINWRDVEKADRLVQLFDRISVRKYGRIVIEAFLGETKKGKLKLNAKVFKNKK